jgi:hypothetical protein
MVKFTHQDREIPESEFNEMTHQMFLLNAELEKRNKPIVSPPKDFREFEDRIGEFEEKLRNLFFGLTYDIETKKTLKREKTPEAIVEALCKHEKYFQKHNVINEQLSPLFVLMLAIERDAPLVVCEDTYLLGIERDRSGLTLPQKNKISVQAAAQVLWYLEKDRIPNIGKMTNLLLDKSNALYKLFKIGRFSPTSRAITIWVSEIFPVPKGNRQGHKFHHSDHFDNLIRIPGVFQEGYSTLNVLKLRFALDCITKVLELKGWTVDEIKRCDLVNFYLEPIRKYPLYLLCDWIRCSGLPKLSKALLLDIGYENHCFKQSKKEG